MRSVMKLILNSLWGKLCQNGNKSSVHFINESYELYDLITDHQYKSVYFDISDSKTARVVCNYDTTHSDKINKTCVALGCYVTCYVHLKLWKVLNKLPKHTVLYYDTDSIIYYSQDGNELLETGTKLGELQSELKKKLIYHIFCIYRSEKLYLSNQSWKRNYSCEGL